MMEGETEEAEEVERGRGERPDSNFATRNPKHDHFPKLEMKRKPQENPKKREKKREKKTKTNKENGGDQKERRRERDMKTGESKEKVDRN